ncbi:hypothetical protein MRY87_08405 [bacterium]|nr:hypothetical protein [bacterium]
MARNFLKPAEDGRDCEALSRLEGRIQGLVTEVDQLVDYDREKGSLIRDLKQEERDVAAARRSDLWGLFGPTTLAFSVTAFLQGTVAPSSLAGTGPLLGITAGAFMLSLAARYLPSIGVSRYTTHGDYRSKVREPRARVRNDNGA